MYTKIQVTIAKSHRKERMRELHKEIISRNYLAGMAVRNRARQLVPVLTSHLQQNIVFLLVDDGVIIGTDVEYGKYQELGTRHHNPQPYLVPGLISSKANLRKIYGAKGLGDMNRGPTGPGTGRGTRPPRTSPT